MKDVPAPYNLSCLLWRDQDTQMFVGHCLNFDVMESGPSVEVAWDRLKKVLKDHIEYCYTFNREGLRRVAPQKDWDRFFKIVQRDPKQLTRVEKLELELREPSLPEHELGLWVLGAMQDGGLTACDDFQAGEREIPVH